DGSTNAVARWRDRAQLRADIGCPFEPRCRHTGQIARHFHITVEYERARSTKTSDKQPELEHDVIARPQRGDLMARDVIVRCEHEDGKVKGRQVVDEGFDEGAAEGKKALIPHGDVGVLVE